jgi:hypothetical protein
MKDLMGDDADAIAVKLKAVRIPDSAKHEKVQFYYDGKLIFMFGIRRGSGEVWHGYIPKQMKISPKQCRTFRKCDMSLEELVDILKAKRVIAS